MKHLKLILAGVLISGTVIVACNKQKINPGKNNISEIQSVENENTDKSANNFENPYEFAGEIHNLALEKVRSHPNYKNLTIDEKFYIINKTVTDEMNQRGMEIGGSTPEIDADFRLYLENMPPSEEIWSSMLVKMSKPEQQIMRNFEREIVNFKEHKNFGLTIANMKRLENQSDKNPNLKDKDLILGMLAIGRNSFSYWRELDILNGDDLFLSKGKWRADINGFFDGWSPPGSTGWGFKEHWRSAVDNASTQSELSQK